MQPVMLGIAAYLLLQFAIGIAVSRRIASENDYLIAGRRLGVGLAAFSIFATWFGAETVIGAAGSIYSDGLAGGSADPYGYGLCLVLLGAVVAVPLWRRKYTTFGDLFRERYSRGVERLAVLLMVPTSVLWAAAQVRAFGQVVSATSGVDVSAAIGMAAALVILYTIAGGLLADVITDMVQGVAVIAGLVLLFVVIGHASGGIAGLSAMIEPERLQLFSLEGRGAVELAEAWAVPVFGSLLAVEMLSRILGCRSAETARNATFAGAGLYLLVGSIPVVIGLAGPALAPGLEEPEQLIAVLAQQHLSTIAYVIFTGALISAILSTVDSCLLAAASLVSHNLVLPVWPAMSERGKVLCARAGVALFGATAYAIALHADGVYALVETASAFGSAGIFVVGMFGLHTRRVGGALAAYAALVTGMLVWGAGEYWLAWSAPYVTALVCALGAYLAGALVEQRAAAASAVAANVPEQPL